MLLPLIRPNGGNGSRGKGCGFGLGQPQLTAVSNRHKIITFIVSYLSYAYAFLPYVCVRSYLRRVTNVAT